MLDVQCMGCMGMYDSDLSVCPCCGFNEIEYKVISYHLKPHTILNDTYIVGKSIGYGGFGITYVGYNAILEKKVAIKEYLPGEFATRSPGEATVTAFTGDKEKAYYKGLEQFEHEAKRLAALKDKSGIVDIYDCFRANNTVYIVMECLEGETLKELLKREKRLKVDKSTDIIIKVLEALKQVHGEGIIHRDISPENIFLTTSGEVKLIDFGAARNATTGLSKSLSVIIKQGYAPPEQYYSKGKQGSWTDVYAAAATYYKMLTGITPETSVERKSNDTLVPPTKLKARLNKQQEIALLNALELDIADRTATATEFLNGITGDNKRLKRTKLKKKKTDLGRVSIKLKAAIIAGVIIIAIAFALGYSISRNNAISDRESLKESQAYVPNMLGMTYEEAVELCTHNDLVLTVVKREFKNDMPSDIVINQDISAGSLVDKGTEIAVVISNGGTGIYIDNYVGLHKEQVIARLDELGLYGEFKEEESALEPGIIISQDIDYVTAVQKGAVITFYVSAGLGDIDEANIIAPNFVGMTYEAAIDQAKASNIHIKRTKLTYSDSIPSGQIISQNIEAGSQIKTGTTVEIEVSGGVEMVRIPNTTGAKITATEESLKALGLNPIVDYDTYFTGYACSVIDLDIAEGTLVPKGSDVIIFGRRGLTFDAYLTDPPNEFGNSYKVGDELKVTIHIDAEQKGMNLAWHKEFGFKYNRDLLEYKSISGNAQATLVDGHEEYGDCMLIRYDWSGEHVEDDITLTFQTKSQGKDEIGVFFYQTWLTENTSDAHLWTYDTILDDYTVLESLDHIVDIEIVK